jgi:hypothetical protein
MESKTAQTSAGSDPAAAVGAVLARLRQTVQVWIDGDRVLPIDGLALLVALDQAQKGLAGPRGAPGAAAESGITAFVGHVQALIEARVLAAEVGLPPIEAASAMAALLSGADGRAGRGEPDAARSRYRDREKGNDEARPAGSSGRGPEIQPGTRGGPLLLPRREPGSEYPGV